MILLIISAALFAGKSRLWRKQAALHADSTQIGNFVEPDFPFISTSVDARSLGTAFPKSNIAARTLALQLGDSAYVCFDTDLLRWSVAWTGKFLPMVQMAQISYRDFFNKNNQVTTVTGSPRIATGSYAGWSVEAPAFSDENRQPSWQPMPAEQGRWKGLYVFGKQAILQYTVGKSEISELPGAARFGSETAFTRTMQVGAGGTDLYFTAADVPNASGSEIKGQIAYVYQGAGKDSVTAVAVLGKSGGVQAGITNGRYLTVRIPASARSRDMAVAIWKGPASRRGEFEKYCRIKPAAMPDFRKGGPAHWKQAVTTAGKLAPDTAAYVTDQLTLPLPNPWKRNVRVADVGFFSNGRAAVVTFDGDVWTVDGISKNLAQLKWKRFASGLHEPMSIEIVKDSVYVFGREGIVRLHDINHDGEADFYENYSNIMQQSPESREWAADLVTAPDGNFYIAKGGSLDNGPGVTKAVAKGFRAGSDQNGSVIRIYEHGRKMEIVATGFRGPYLGMHPRTGALTASDQQGNFVPSTPIYLIKKGDYFGVEPTVHRKDQPEITRPLTWIPHNVDRSSISQAWVTSDRMGPLNGSLVHFSFGRPGLFRVLIDSAATNIQGGVSVIHADYPAPTSKGAMNPADGQLYVGGFNLWGSTSTGISALLRLRYTGKTSLLPGHFRAGKQGIVLGFDTPLDRKTAEDVSHYQIKRWNYKRTEEYGSGHFKTDGSKGEETLPVAGAYLSADNRKVLLLIPDMQEVEQMELNYTLRTTSGLATAEGFWFTVNDAGDMDLSRYGFKDVNLALLSVKNESAPVKAAKEAPATAQAGKALFQKMACAGCHSEGLKTDGMYGPPFQNLYKSRRTFEDGSTTVADEKYIRESILDPGRKVVKGYSPEMPSFEGVLSDNEIESITLYLKSLAGK
ncbi:c-type cytochrome [Dyadobacter sandarakinus]|uniref:C-type cytochrome n=2 Tax=Dyadobacter sandarakinus TaxID=2747268 RepID=A0ABX7IDX5_9BACT|nr:c-type cytochrome [Dyadobacter sandarakinus]